MASTKEEQREKIYRIAKKSIIFKPVVFKKVYKVSSKIRKQLVNEAIDTFVKNKLSKTELIRLKRDLVYCKVFYNIAFDEYFLYGFENKSHLKRKNFIPNKNRYKYLNLLGNRIGYQTLTDKYKAYEIFKKYYKREIIQISEEADYAKFKNFIKNRNVFVKKPIGGSFGKGIELIKVKDYKNDKDLFHNLLNEGKVILEEQIISDEKMASLHPSSLNTVRIITYIDENKEVVIHLPFIKIGQKGTFVDNGGSGGIFAMIDPKTGVIITDGKDELNNVFKVHPDTKVKIKGFQVPKWDEMVSLVKEACKTFPERNYIGWDVGLSKDNGPVVVEANGKTQFYGQQICDEIGKRKDLEKLINYKKIKNLSKNPYIETKTWKGRYKFSVIVPIYNLEKFLEEGLDTIVKQTIGFTKNIQLILINDGSTDNSEEICLKYKKLYPDNVIYKKQKNSGVSSARNYGLSFAMGKYINFFDGDDKWAYDVFKLVWDFFEDNYTDTDIVTCRQRYFESLSKYHALDYKFKSGIKLADINKNPSYVQASVCSSFFLRDAIMDKKFDESMRYAEDAKFLNEVLLEKEKIGLLREAQYFYRKRNDNSSATQNQKKLLTRYIDNLNKYYIYFYDLSLKKYRKVIPYVQHLIMNAIKYRVKEDIPKGLMTKKQKDEYIYGIIDLIKRTDDNVLVNMRNASYQTKLYMLKLKYDDIKDKLIKKGDSLYFEEYLMSKKSLGITLYMSDLSIVDNNLIAKGYLEGSPYVTMDSLIVKKGKDIIREFALKENAELEKKSFINESINSIFDFEIKGNLNKDVTKYQFFVKINDEMIKIKLNFTTKSNLKRLDNNYLRLGNKMLVVNGSILFIKNYKLARVLKYKIKK